jgi:hypothetical protein
MYIWKLKTLELGSALSSLPLVECKFRNELYEYESFDDVFFLWLRKCMEIGQGKIKQLVLYILLGRISGAFALPSCRYFCLKYMGGKLSILSFSSVT